MLNAKDKILITGATSGIGKATAILLRQTCPQATLYLLGRRNDRLQELVRNLGTTNVVAIEADVKNKNTLYSAFDKHPDLKNGLTILVNNAGLAAGLDFLQEGTIEDWEAMIDTNVKGLLYVTRYLLPGMVERKKGHILHLGSVAGYQVYPKGNVYCATKFAVRALNDSLRYDVHGTGIRVTSIDPGLVDTEFSLVRFKGDKERADSVYSNTRPLHPEDVAEAVVWSLQRPEHVNIQNILMMPTDQAGPRDVFRSKY